MLLAFDFICLREGITNDTRERTMLIFYYCFQAMVSQTYKKKKRKKIKLLLLINDVYVLSHFALSFSFVMHCRLRRPNGKWSS